MSVAFLHEQVFAYRAAHNTNARLNGNIIVGNNTTQEKRQQKDKQERLSYQRYLLPNEYAIKDSRNANTPARKKAATGAHHAFFHRAFPNGSAPKIDASCRRVASMSFGYGAVNVICSPVFGCAIVS